jgi:hypothetical protein
MHRRLTGNLCCLLLTPDADGSQRVVTVACGPLPTPHQLALGAGPRVMHAAHIMQKAQQWIVETLPRYWNRHGGRDHIWTSVNDEGTLRAA